jgi:hypothetical protein
MEHNLQGKADRVHQDRCLNWPLPACCRDLTPCWGALVGLSLTHVSQGQSRTSAVQVETVDRQPTMPICRLEMTALTAALGFVCVCTSSRMYAKAEPSIFAKNVPSGSHFQRDHSVAHR